MRERFWVAALMFLLVSISGATRGFGQISLPPSGIIRTVAGSGVQGYSGDEGAATSASMSWMLGVATDLDGNIYIADSGNFRIRKVIAATGEIVTVAGNGSAEISGDGRSAIQAGLGSPVGVAIDAAKNLYILTAGRVREVTATDGIIRTVGGGGQTGYSGDGGPATLAEMNGASGIALDAAGNIFIADFANDRIRKIAASTGMIETIAGTGKSGLAGDGGPGIQADLDGPYTIALDRDGNLYIGEYFSCRVRKLSLVNGLINSIAGDGSCGFSGDTGPATSAQLGQIYGVALDAQGSVYVGDGDNNRIRMVDAETGIISTVAGSGAVGVAGDNGPAIAAELESIYGLALDQSGYLYVLNSATGVVRAIGPGTVQNPTSYHVALSASDPKPTMGEAVTLKAAVASNLGLPAISGTMTWYLGSLRLGQSDVDGSGLASFVTTLGAAGDQQISATYEGSPSGFGTFVLPVSGFTLNAATASPLTIASGKSAQIIVNATAFHGFKRTVDVGCSGLPYPGFCALSTGSVTFTDNLTTENITVTVETAPASAPSANNARSRGGLLVVASGGLMLLGLGRRRRRIVLQLFLLPIAITICFGMSGCGAVSQQRAASPASTTKVALQPGTYALVVSARSGNETVDLPIAVTVK